MNQRGEQKALAVAVFTVKAQERSILAESTVIAAQEMGLLITVTSKCAGDVERGEPPHTSVHNAQEEVVSAALNACMSTELKEDVPHCVWLSRNLRRVDVTRARMRTA